MNTIQRKILYALRQGCKNTRQIGSFWNIPYSTVNNYFYTANNGAPRTVFEKGDLVTWGQLSSTAGKQTQANSKSLTAKGRELTKNWCRYENQLYHFENKENRS